MAPAERSVGMDIVIGILNNVLRVVVEAARERSHDEMVTRFAVREMDEVGHGKVRFVAAWVISRVLKKAKKYVKDNLYTTSSNSRVQVNKTISKIEALERTIVMPYDILPTESKYPGTLNVTDWRQYRSHGLIHVSDGYDEFALELEQKPVEGLNNKMFKLHSDHLVDVLEASLCADDSLIPLWKALFTGVDLLVRNRTLELHEIIST